jgi:hypothetical protein
LWKELQWKNMVFVSSNWHLPRAEALLNNIANFTDPADSVVVADFIAAIRDGEVLVQFIGSADVLSLKSEKYKRYFAAVDEDPGMQMRIETESNALVQIAHGEYGGKKLSRVDKIWPERL